MPPSGIPTILLVDDQPAVLRELVGTLSVEFPEARLLQTTDPLQALDIARGEAPQLVLTDWDMPELTGLELVERLRAQAPDRDVACVICTGKHVDSSDLSRALALGAVDYLRKPFDAIELAARVRAALRERDYTAQIRAQNAELERQRGELAAEKERTERLLNEQLALQQQDIELLALELQRNREFAERLSSRLGAAIRGDKPEPGEVRALLRELEHELLSGDRLHTLRSDLDAVNAAFYKRLDAYLPGLTPGERELCAFLKLGLTGKEIAVLRGITPNAVKKARQRLRRKLAIDPDEDLSAVLSRLA